VSPRSTSARVTWAPTNPVAPVTKTFRGGIGRSLPPQPYDDAQCRA
jgi:hypothetical protein